MKLLVCGGRDFRDRDAVWGCLDAAAHYANLSEVVCGYDPDDKRYQGADQLAYEWAVEHDFAVRNFPAPWKAKGRAAGPIRNQQMADYGPDEGIAFPRANGEWGPGTLNMMAKAAAKGIRIEQVSVPAKP